MVGLGEAVGDCVGGAEYWPTVKVISAPAIDSSASLRAYAKYLAVLILLSSGLLVNGDYRKASAS